MNSLHVLWRRIRPSRLRTFSSVSLASLSLICAIALLATSAWLISRAWQQPPILYLEVAVVSVRAFGIGRGFFRYSERLVSHSGALASLNKLRVIIVERIAVTAPAGNRNYRRGDALRAMVSDVDAVAEVGVRSSIPTNSAVIVGLLTVGGIALLLPMAGIVLLIGLLVGGIGSSLITSRVAAKSETDNVAHNALYAADLASAFDKIGLLVTTNSFDEATQTLHKHEAAINTAQAKTARGMALASAISAGAQGLCLIAMVLVTAPAVLSGALPGVDLAVAVLLPLAAFEIVLALPAAAVARKRAKSAATRVNAIVEAPDPMPDNENCVALAAAQRTYTLSTHSISVTWPDTEHPAVSGISFSVSTGERLAIIGPSGSGKSSIAAALVGFAPHTGTITLDGIDYNRLCGDDIRTVVTLCEQDPYIFDNTIAENIRLAKPGCSDDEILHAATTAGLANWLQELPHGLATRVGEHGSAVSGGQRQRIGLARAVLHDAPIVILDEPTEHLDTATAEQLQRDIFAVLHDKAVIIISHNHQVLTQVDRVVDVTSTPGRSGESGTYASDLTFVGS